MYTYTYSIPNQECISWLVQADFSQAVLDLMPTHCWEGSPRPGVDVALVDSCLLLLMPLARFNAS